MLGVGGQVFALAMYDVNGTRELIIGGQFSSLGDFSTAANYIARWDGACFRTLRTGFGASVGVDNNVNALAVVNGLLYLGGAFTQVTGGAANSHKYIATWNGGTGAWGALAGGQGTNLNGLGGQVMCLLDDGSGGVVVGGDFSSLANTTMQPKFYGLARWTADSAAWQPVPDVEGYNGVLSTSLFSPPKVLALARSGQQLFVAGDEIISTGGTAERLYARNILSYTLPTPP
jgi:hypothetical protein